MNIIMESSRTSNVLVLVFENKKEKEIYMNLFADYSKSTRIDIGNKIVERSKSREEINELSIIVFANEITQFIELLIYGSLYEKTKLLEDHSTTIKELSNSYSKHMELLEKFKSLSKRYDELLIKHNSMKNK